MRTGTRLTLRITLKGAVGKGYEYTIKPNRRGDIGPKRAFCMRPGTEREGSCSTQR